jgi:hypothetical protein
LPLEEEKMKAILSVKDLKLDSGFRFITKKSSLIKLVRICAICSNCCGGGVGGY